MSLIAFQSPNEVGALSKLNLCHEADLQLSHNELSARHSRLRQSRHSSSTEESDGAKKSTLKFLQDSWRRTTSQSWSWRWQVLQVQCAMRPMPSCEREANNHWNDGFLGSPPNSWCRIWPRVGQVQRYPRLQQVKGKLTQPKLCSYASGKRARFFSVAKSLTHQAQI